MIARILVTGLLALVLGGPLVELSCLAGEARARAPRAGLATGVPEPGLPVASEIEDRGPALGPALTR